MRQLLAIAVGSMLILGCTARPGAPSASPAATEPVIAVASPSAPSPTPRATATPTMSPAPTATPPPTDEPELETPSAVEATERPTQPDPAGRPALRLPSGVEVSPSLEGGCGWFAYEGEIFTSDACGPTEFDRALERDPVSAAPSSVVTIVPAGGWRIGADESLGIPWAVRVAGASRLRGEEEANGGFPDRVGRGLAEGTETQRVVSVQAPTSPGEYLLQLDAPFWRDGWSNMSGTYYWHILVQ